MEILEICRVCLSDSVKMHRIAGTEFKELYEKLADTKLEAEDGRPTMLCYICYPQLVRCCKFLQTAKKSETVLAQLYNTGVVFTQDLLVMLDRPPVYSFAVTPIESVNIDSKSTEVMSTGNDSKGIALTDVNPKVPLLTNGNCSEKYIEQNIKSEIYEEYNKEVKETVAEDVKEDPDGHPMDGDLNNVDLDLTDEETNLEYTISYDSEDDLPLTSLKMEGQVIKHHKVKGQKVKEERVKRKYTKRMSLDVRVVHLTKEQQLQEMAARSTSLNYISSAHQCSLCYRGFSSAGAFANHQEKHDESSGPFECDVCRMRYRTPRHLRTHLTTAHARYYRCNKCTHLSHTANQAIDHQRWHSGHKYECQLCGHTFLNLSSYLSHLRKWHPTEHICNICGDRFIGKHGLLMHKTKTHRHSHKDPDDGTRAEERFCATCNIQFVTMDAWKRHILASIKHTLHTKDNNYCEICSVTVEGSLSLHMKDHAKKLSKPVPKRSVPRGAECLRVACEQCGERFLNKGKLSVHIKRVHLGLKYNKSMVCELCGKKCVSNASLKSHQRTHSGERPYKCQTCSKCFFNNDHLRIHMRTHTGEKPYTCEHCSKTFTQKPALNRHYRVHTGVKPYSCTLCGKSFSQSNSLKGHITAVHLKMAPYRGKNKEKIAQEAVNKSESV